MKIVKYLSLALVALLATSCEKHVIEFNAEPIPANSAMVQIHYMVPQSSGTSKNIYKIELNGEALVNNNAAMMTVYGTSPGNSKYYAVKEGSASLKLYQSSDMNLVYDNTISGLKAGKKYQVFVHDFAQAPIVIDSDFSFKNDVATEENMTELTAQHHFWNFYNFLYEDTGAPYQGALQYQYQVIEDWDAYNAWLALDEAAQETAWDGKCEWINVGAPVAFGESTGWQKLPVYKDPEAIDANYATSWVRIIIPGEVDENGEPVVFDRIKSNGSGYSAWDDYWSVYGGRHCHHFLRGFRSNTDSRYGVTQWVAY